MRDDRSFDISPYVCPPQYDDVVHEGNMLKSCSMFLFFDAKPVCLRFTGTMFAILHVAYAFVFRYVRTEQHAYLWYLRLCGLDPQQACMIQNEKGTYESRVWDTPKYLGYLPSNLSAKPDGHDTIVLLTQLLSVLFRYQMRHPCHPLTQESPSYHTLCDGRRNIAIFMCFVPVCLGSPWRVHGAEEYFLMAFRPTNHRGGASFQTTASTTANAQHPRQVEARHPRRPHFTNNSTQARVAP